MVLFKNIRLITLTALCLTIWPPTTSFAQELRDPALDAVLDKIKTDYGVNLHYAQGPNEKYIDLDYSLADVEDKEILRKIILLFVQEISRYHKDFFRDAGCRDIYFVQKLFMKKRPVEGVFSTRTNYIFYDYSRSNRNPQKIRHNIHHELFHMIGSKHPFWKEHGPAWRASNRPGFAYKPEEYNMHGQNPINFLAPPEPGFITHYAMASVEEDRAEVFACLMLPEELRLMEQWARKDRILFNKVAMMKEFRKTNEEKLPYIPLGQPKIPIKGQLPN